jgi:hypothetical protein
MVSALTFDKAVEVFRAYLARTGSADDARERLLDFLQWDSPDEEEFGQAVRIVLASAEFSKELTTSVIWLNRQGLDIRCVRLRPYRHNTLTILDVQQVVPLPEAADYQVQLRQKEQQAKQERAERQDLRHRFLSGLLARARPRTAIHANVAASGDAGWVGASSGISGLSYVYVIMQNEARTELYLDRGDKQTNKQIFDALLAKKPEIESAFGDSLFWERLDDKRACRISHTTASGGYRDDEQLWPKIQDDMIHWMIKLEASLRPHLKAGADLNH